MFQNLLKWTFKVVVGEVEKELNLHLDNDTPIEAVEQVAIQMIAHCSKVKEALAAQVVPVVAPVDQSVPTEEPKVESIHEQPKE